MTTNTPTTASASRLGRAALIAGSALALFGTVAIGEAHAATGTFFYHSPESGDLEFDNPDNGECRLLLQGADRATNHTNTRVTLYFDRGCEEPAGTMAPGEHRAFSDPIPRSVMFG
ncbi:hypothetical protein NLX83_38045 [Allokutzneria sp. A3M-2-11 16]|uniref:hypothetical protein n=1 Tax=Allokutzneria sp. A3M-2-11 16 TaxID=2962043 RepID=UPI0020B7FCED|nr:hypothetical protein [Allokutzneria sp. A3M-2-11 16]MCP3805083.1 hypothetical protein [Allokutzneria sp. A3M-2-11 16]